MAPESVRFSTVTATGTGLHPLNDKEFNPTKRAEPRHASAKTIIANRLDAESRTLAKPMIGG